MRACPGCGFVFNAAFDEQLLSYGPQYDNVQSYSGHFAEHEAGLVRQLVEIGGVRAQRIVEVGCGQGQFLERLIAADPGNRGIGFDPSCRRADSADGRLRFHREYYSDGSAMPADVVISRHVIEHVADPVALLHAMASTESDNLRLFIETPCVEWILRNDVIWDLFYEHCSLFSFASLRMAFTRVGLECIEQTHVFSGQYLFVEAGRRVHDRAEVAVPAAVDLATGFAQRYARALARWQQRIEALARSGRVAIWGAGAKGSTFVNIVDPAGELVNCLVDVNPGKHGKFVAGTGHEIIAPHQLAERRIAAVVIMNPNYEEEIAGWIRNAGLAIDLVCA